MNSSSEEEKLVRSYLLGELSADKLRQVEERLMTDNIFNEQVDIAEDELIDDCVQGRLSENEKTRLEAVYLSTPEGRKRINFAEALIEYALKRTNPGSAIKNQKPARRAMFSNPTLRLATAIVILVCLGLGVWRLFFYKSNVDKGLAALRKAYSGQRLLEARISEFDYAPYSATRSSGQSNVDQLSLTVAETHLSQEAFDNPDAESYYALGKFYLAGRNFDRAIEYLEKASNDAPNDARIHADLGAAYFELGKSSSRDNDAGKSKELLAVSLSHLKKALALDPSVHETLFNLALLYQEMRLNTDAKQSWESYLETDSNSQWAEEAREKLKELADEKNSKAGEELYQEFLDAFNNRDHAKGSDALNKSFEDGWSLIVDRLSREYLTNSSERKSAQAKIALSALKFAADTELNNCGDRSITDLAQSYSSLSTEQAQRLCKAEDAIKMARQETAKSDYAKAATYFLNAKNILDHDGDKVRSLYFEHKIAHCYILDSKIDSAIEIFNRLLNYCESKTYINLCARVLETLAIAYNYRKETSKELESRVRALELYEKTGNVIGKLQTYIYLAGIYQNVGNASMSLDYLSRALDLVGRCPMSRREIASMYRAASGGFALMGLYDAAIAYQKECLKINLEGGSLIRVSKAYTFLGDLYRKNKSYSEAVSNIQLAIEVAKSVSDESSRKDMESYALMYLGDSYRDSGDCENAFKCYDEVIALNQQLNIPLWNYNARKGKLMCYIAGGDDDHIRSEIDETLNLYRQNRAKILEDANKISFGDSEQNVFDIAIGYEFSGPDGKAKAFDLAEENRARSFSDMLSSTEASSKSFKLDDIKKHMPEEAQLLEYAVLEDRIIIWLMTSENFICTDTPIGSSNLNELVLSYLKKISTPRDRDLQEIEEQSTKLYTLLIKPIEDNLDREKTLCIVPDKILHYVPFNTLRSMKSGNHMVKDFSLMYSLSANVFVHCSDIARQKAAQSEESLLIVGNPRFDRSQFTTLADLSSARREAEKLARLYNKPTLLIEEHATEAAVREQMLNCDVIHLATHCVTEESSPLLTKLVFAKPLSSQSGESEDGLLHAYEIYAMKLSARLVVLSACQSGVERWYSGEGAIGIARPFLKSDVPLVIASLWKVDTESTAELMESFHKFRKQGDSAKALRLAQLEMLKGNNRRFRHPYYWAAFVPVGGYTTF